ncbi:MAG: flagellar biosynthetic protein FliR [Fimbriimonadales bacterium]|nr:MAG: flagellar biosynthetic protein FliR [Fimbriimonadales bacterium]
MSLDIEWFWAFLTAFVRASGLALMAPVFGSRLVPAPVRVGLSAVIALALAPSIQPYTGAPPTEWVPLILRVLGEVIIGLVLGYGVSLIIGAAVMAGEVLDTMMGFNLMQVLNPVSSFPTTLLAQFHYMLAMTLFALVNGHHWLLLALARSFETGAGLGSLSVWSEGSLTTAMQLGGEVMMLCIQIAAPAGGVLLVVDAAMAAISRAVPQIPVWLIGMPAKIAVGVAALGASLPALIGMSTRMTELSIQYLEQQLQLLGV